MTSHFTDNDQEAADGNEGFVEICEVADDAGDASFSRVRLEPSHHYPDVRLAVVGFVFILAGILFLIVPRVIKDEYSRKKSGYFIIGGLLVLLGLILFVLNALWCRQHSIQRQRALDVAEDWYRNEDVVQLKIQSTNVIGHERSDKMLIHTEHRVNNVLKAGIDPEMPFGQQVIRVGKTSTNSAAWLVNKSVQERPLHHRPQTTSYEHQYMALQGPETDGSHAEPHKSTRLPQASISTGGRIVSAYSPCGSENWIQWCGDEEAQQHYQNETHTPNKPIGFSNPNYLDSPPH